MEIKKNYIAPQCFYIELSYEDVLLNNESNDNRLPYEDVG